MSSYSFDDPDRRLRRPAAPLDREQALAMSLGALDGTWLQLNCAESLRFRTSRSPSARCAVVGYPLRLLAKRRGAEASLGELLPRFRCRHCRGRPTVVLLTPVAVDTASEGERLPWVLPLRPATWDELLRMSGS